MLVVLSVLMGRCTSARVGPPLTVLVSREVNRVVRIEDIIIVNWSIGCVWYGVGGVKVTVKDCCGEVR